MLTQWKSVVCHMHLHAPVCVYSVSACGISVAFLSFVLYCWGRRCGWRWAFALSSQTTSLKTSSWLVCWMSGSGFGACHECRKVLNKILSAYVLHLAATSPAAWKSDCFFGPWRKGRCAAGLVDGCAALAVFDEGRFLNFLCTKQCLVKISFFVCLPWFFCCHLLIFRRASVLPCASAVRCKPQRLTQSSL